MSFLKIIMIIMLFSNIIIHKYNNQWPSGIISGGVLNQNGVRKTASATRESSSSSTSTAIVVVNEMTGFVKHKFLAKGKILWIKTINFCQVELFSCVNRNEERHLQKYQKIKFYWIIDHMKISMLIRVSCLNSSITLI